MGWESRGKNCRPFTEERKGSSLCLTHLGGADYADFFIHRLLRLRRFFLVFLEKEVKSLLDSSLVRAEITQIFLSTDYTDYADFFFGFFCGREVAGRDVSFAMAVGWYSINITYLWKSVLSVDKLNKGPRIPQNFYPQITQITQIFFWGEIGGWL